MNKETTKTKPDDPESPASEVDLSDAHCSALPFHSANLTGEKRIFLLLTVTLSESRKISVGYAADGVRSIQIARLDDSGKPTKLSFGLSPDAAEALLQGLNKAKAHEMSSENPFQQNVLVQLV